MSKRTPIEILDDVDRLADLTAQIKAMTAESDSIKNRLREDYAVDFGTHEVGPFRLSVTAPKRFDEAKARELLPADVLAACTEAKLSSTLVKKAVAPALYDLVCVAGEPRVAVS